MTSCKHLKVMCLPIISRSKTMCLHIKVKGHVFYQGQRSCVFLSRSKAMSTYQDQRPFVFLSSSEVMYLSSKVKDAFTFMLFIVHNHIHVVHRSQSKHPANQTFTNSITHSPIHNCHNPLDTHTHTYSILV